MKRLICLVLSAILTFSSMSVFAGKKMFTDNKVETTVTFHNGSQWYIDNGSWIKDASSCYYKENGKFYVPITSLKNLFGFSESYKTDDGTAVFARFGEVEFWQVIGEKSICVNDVWYDEEPAIVDPYGTAMVPIDVYTVPVGFTIETATPEDYKEGTVTVSKSLPLKYTRVEVNKAMQLVTVYAKGTGDKDVPAWYCLCSTGAPGEETVEGRFTINPLSYGASFGKWYLFKKSNIWVVNCCQIYGDYCFHSILFRNLFNVNSLIYQSFYDLGRKATNGCVRLTVGDSAFIYDNCGGLPVDIGPGYISDKLIAVKSELMNALPDTAQEYIKGIC